VLEAYELRRALKIKPNVHSSLAHMTEIVGGSVLGEVSDIETEIDAWLKENDGNGPDFLVLGDVVVGDLETEACNKMEMENDGGLFAFGGLEHNTKDAEASNSTKQGYQTPLPTNLSLIPLSTHRYLSATTTSSRPRSSSLSSKRWLHRGSLRVRAPCGRLP